MKKTTIGILLGAAFISANAHPLDAKVARLADAVSVHKTKDGSTVREVLNYVEKMRPGKFVYKIGSGAENDHGAFDKHNYVMIDIIYCIGDREQCKPGTEDYRDSISWAGGGSGYSNDGSYKVDTVWTYGPVQTGYVVNQDTLEVLGSKHKGIVDGVSPIEGGKAAFLKWVDTWYGYECKNHGPDERVKYRC